MDPDIRDQEPDIAAAIRSIMARSNAEPEWYFKTFLKVESKDFGLAPLDVTTPKWRAQQYVMDVIKDLRRRGKPIRLIIGKARHEGISSVVSGEIFRTTTHRPHCKSLVIAQDPLASKSIHRKYQLYYDNLPGYYKPSSRYYSKTSLVLEKDPKKLMEDEGFLETLDLGLRSSIDVIDCKKANGYRTASIHCLHCTEVSFWDNAADVWGAIKPMVSNHPDSIVIFETTANGTANFFHRFWVSSKLGMTDFTPIFIPWTWMPDYAIPLEPGETFDLDEEEKILVEDYGCTLEQLKFRRHTISEFAAGYSGSGGQEESLEYGRARFKSEYPINDIEMFQVFQACAFNRIKLDQYIARIKRFNIHPAVFRLMPDPNEYNPNPFDRDWVLQRRAREDEGKFWVWRFPEAGVKYTVSMDPSPGGGDPCYIDVFKWSPARQQVAQWHGWDDVPNLAQIAVFIAKLYNRAMLAIEVTGIGISIQQCVTKLKYNRCYEWQYLDRASGKGVSSWLGWKTTNETKKILVQHANFLINNGLPEINSLLTLQQMTHFIEIPGNGEWIVYQASSGEQDDAVMSWMIGMFTTQMKEQGGNTGILMQGNHGPAQEMTGAQIPVQASEYVHHGVIRMPQERTYDEL